MGSVPTRTRWLAITVDSGWWSVRVVADFTLEEIRSEFLDCHYGAEIIDDSIGLFADGRRKVPYPDEEQ